MWQYVKNRQRRKKVYNEGDASEPQSQSVNFNSCFVWYLVRLYRLRFFWTGDNNPPSIETLTDETITDQTLTLAVNSRKTVEFFVTDVDDDDTHTVSASSENTTIATASVADTAVTIKGLAAGSTTVTITATDDSGQDNAASSIVYEVNVIEPQVVASTSSPLTELSLDEGVVTLTLVGLTYDQQALFYFSQFDTVTVSGIDDIRIKPTNSARVSDTVAKVSLIFSGNIDTDTTLIFTVEAGAIAEYDGPPTHGANTCNRCN